MSDKGKRKDSGKRGSEWQGFVNFNLGATDKKNIKQRVDAGVDVLSQLHELVEEGYSVKLAWDSYSECPSAILLGSKTDNGNRGWGMSCRHSDLYTALVGLLYQHVDLSGDGGEWPKPSDIHSEHDW